MSLNDPLANALSMILNAEKIGKKECEIKPISDLMKKTFTLLKDNGYLGSYQEVNDNRGGFIRINLLGRINKIGVIKPRFSVKATDYEKFEKRYLLAKDFGVMIVSTPKGLMTNEDAKKQKLGGRLIAYCY